MKTKLITALLVAVGLPVMAGVFASTDPDLPATISDNDPNGYVSQVDVSGLGPVETSLSVTLDISGGYNGDLYAYLLGPQGQMTVLLNRVGQGTGSEPTTTYGYSNPGFNSVVLSDSGAYGVHDYQANGGQTVGQLTGTWQPDSGVSFATQYGGTNPNGTWSLFIADLSPGDQSTLVGWSLDITAVPEPVNVALGVFGLALLGFGLARRNAGKPVTA